MNYQPEVSTRSDRLSRRSLFAMLLAASALLLAGFGMWQRMSDSHVSSLPFYNDADFTPIWFESDDDIPVDFHAIPAFALLDQEGNRLTQSDLDGNVVIANFFFTACPGICPSTMGNMHRVQEAFEQVEHVMMISHSVTTDTDDVAALAAFAEDTHVISGKWHLVTGEREVIYDLGKHAYFAEEDLGERVEEAGDSVFLHTEQFFLLDGQRRIRGVYNGMNSTSVLQLIEDAKRLAH